MKGPSLSVVAALAALTQLPESAFKAAASLIPENRNLHAKAAREAQFREMHEDSIAANAAFNQSVNTRQVRRYYARIMAKRGVESKDAA